ncbi:MAG: ATP-grasp domain-containing protein [Gammaproteobacteria bacterium]
MRSKLLANTSIKSNYLIIISHSARALSESASRAGWNVISVDGFADTDTLESCSECWCLPLNAGEFVRSQLETCLTKLKQRYPQAKVILGAGVENLASNIEQFPSWQLCANSSKTTSQLKDPHIFFEALRKLQVEYPSVQYGTTKPESGNWLYKLSDSCGGMGVSREYIDNPQGYWQQKIPGVAVSALCISDGQDVFCLGVNQQYSISSFGAYPYVYLGALANAEISPVIKEKTATYTDKIINHFKLKGVFSVDMVLVDQREQQGLYVLEVNPRISASFELYERINPGLNLVDAHIRVCEGERLSEIQLSNSQSAYLIVYAKNDCLISDQLVWPPWVKDKPEGLRQISQHEPICSVYADAGETDDSLYLLLQRRADEVISLINQQFI